MVERAFVRLTEVHHFQAVGVDHFQSVGSTIDAALDELKDVPAIESRRAARRGSRTPCCSSSAASFSRLAPAPTGASSDEAREERQSQSL
jgi:hypothetical protein